MGDVVKFDGAQQMLEDLSNAPETANSCMCAVMMVDQSGQITTAFSHDPDLRNVRPFVFVGALELMKRRVMGEFMEKLDEL